MREHVTTPDGMSRRHFFGHLAASAAAVPAMQLVGAMGAHAAAGKKATKSCILLWMGGGPSHMDTWSLKPDSKNGGEFKPIATSAPGVEISEHLPGMARVMKHMSIIRSLNSNEGNHDRGTYKMHTGYVPNPTMVHPSIGSVISYELGPKLGDFDLPHCVAINGAGVGAGFLGMAHTPFQVDNPNGEISNLRPPKEVEQRMQRRLAMYDLVESGFASGRGQAAQDHKAVYQKTLKMMTSRATRAFDLKTEPDAVRDRYGRDGFGAGCLMARKLVEAGVSFVEVSLGGWDNHAGIFATLKDERLPVLDKGFSALVEDLQQRGLLDSTLIVWMGDFGRTPRINQDGGRDHWPNSWSIVMGGGGLKGGQVIGDTDKDGIDVVDRPIGVMDVTATMAKAMGISLETHYTTPRGRPYKLVEGGAPISELIG